MKVFITGGTGFVGSHLAEHLINQHDAEVFALMRDLKKPKWLKGLDIHPLNGNLFSIPDLPEDLDFVFHLAGLTKAYKSADYYTVNQKGTASLFQSIQEQRIKPKKIIYLSSMAAAGPSSQGTPVREDHSSAPVTLYGDSKLQGEQEALKFKDELFSVILRVGAVYGPRDRDFLKYFRTINRGILPVMGKKDRLLNLCYVKDLCQALILAAQADLDSGEIFHIAHPQPHSWNEIGQISGEILNKKLITVRIPLPLVYLAAAGSDLISLFTKKRSIINKQKYLEFKQEGWLSDTLKAEKQLLFKAAFPLREGLKETLQWYQDQGWL